MEAEEGGEEELMKEASRERLLLVREKRTMCLKPCLANRRAMCEPIMGPEPMMKMGPAGAMVVVVVSVEEIEEAIEGRVRRKEVEMFEKGGIGDRD